MRYKPKSMAVIIYETGNVNIDVTVSTKKGLHVIPVKCPASQNTVFQ